MCIWGLVSVVAEVRPFWVDEWRIIYNLKFKDNKSIWGQLAFMQQFPRTYLFLFKQFTSKFNYSYQSLRLLPYAAGVATILYLFSLSGKIFSKSTLRFVFIMMLVSSGTFTQYFVEVKQYTMELLLSVLAVGQLLYLLNLGNNMNAKPAKYILLCIGMAIAPFFSYTYPVVIAPVYAVLLTNHVLNALNGQKTPYPTLAKQWFPLFLGTFGITMFYATDVVQVAADNDMHKYWQHLLGGTAPLYRLPERIFHFLAQPGSGFLFWWLFGMCGLVAIIVVAKNTYHYLRIRLMRTEHYLNLYGLLTVALVISLNLIGKIPLGEPRLNAFGIPAIALLVTALLNKIENRYPKQGKYLTYIILAGLVGNIYTTIIASFTDVKYKRRMAIYNATENAILLAQKVKMPILITPDVAWPYNNTRNYPFDDELPGDWVLMTWPAFNPNDRVEVYAVPEWKQLPQYLNRLPPYINRVVAGDGLQFDVVDVTVNKQ
jgi:hypothetical protein